MTYDVDKNNGAGVEDIYIIFDILSPAIRESSRQGFHLVLYMTLTLTLSLSQAMDDTQRKSLKILLLFYMFLQHS